MSFLVAAVLAFLAVAVAQFAMRRPDYRHFRDTISELGERGAPDGKLVSLCVFLPVGLAMSAVALSVGDAPSGTSWLAGVIAVGYLGAAVFPADPGAPLRGTWRQSAHNAAGAVQYFGGAFALSVLARELGHGFDLLAAMVAVGAVVLSVNRWRFCRGLAQRLAELALFAGLMLSI